MTATAAFPESISTGTRIDPEHVDWLEESTSVLDDIAELRRRMSANGYLYLPGLLNREWVAEARESVCRMLQKDGYLDPSAPLTDAVWDKQKLVKFKPEYATGNPAVERLLYSGEMIAFFDRFLGKPTLHFDFTWLRAVCPGAGTSSHCDVVYMGRGEREQLYTAWTPLGDIDFAQGGLAILDGSNNFDALKKTYGNHDVDTHCANRSDGDGWRQGVSWLEGTIGHAGSLGEDPNAVQKAMGGTWRTTEYRAGDVLIFTCYTVHASLDNHSDRIRLSTDSRYQPAGTTLDERWVGTNPIAHSQAGKRGKIC
jgi:hypothetical protein